MQYDCLMGLDYGKARIGVAFSTMSIASADHIYKSQTEEKDLEYFAKLIKQRQVKKVIFGLPFSTDGSENEMTEKVRDFSKKLSNLCGVEIAFQDERYTSFEAEEFLKEAKLPWQKRKELLDKISAQIILQNYLDENPS